MAKLLFKIHKSTYKKTITAVSLSQLTMSLQKILQLIVLWYGASMVLNGEFTLVNLLHLELFQDMNLQPILRLSTIWQQYQEIKISFERLGDIVNTPKENDAEEPGKDSTSKRPRHISFCMMFLLILQEKLKRL